MDNDHVIHISQGQGATDLAPPQQKNLCASTPTFTRATLELIGIRGLMVTETSLDRLMQLAAQVDDSLRNWAERENH